MKLTKDEARVLAQAMRIAKYEMNTLSFNVFDKFTELEDKLEKFGKDKRRIGRTSQDDFNDCLKRFAKS
ncbi:hypothetical protein [Lutibacter maritimus]|uniref:Uncharacterized protein n=1 Tax=Lutibacter maritimus TaxID=593133 RepID=A0A1I6NRN5_9FLAO|nr:hypothetical protein [Lutibacter maritimus]SFS30569.1 hypothetical protein SAMN04488006_0453 [Lutibacter maritimus]